MKGCIKMHISQFDYELPEELIAQEPSPVRGQDRMLILNPVPLQMSIHPFESISDNLERGDAIVINNTRVIPARMFAQKEETGAEIELLFLNPATENKWICMAKGAKRLSSGTRLRLKSVKGELSDHVVKSVGRLSDGTCLIDLEKHDTKTLFELCGHLPLPPYIKRPDQPMDSERYQTIYATRKGAVAAPTAGLHFTDKTFQSIRDKGVSIIELTLHVGAGTFKPVSVERIEDHVMHEEYYILSEQAAQQLNETRKNGGRILAVGTTSLRTLETTVGDNGFFTAGSGATSIFIYPPYHIKSADMLLTNFHLPKSTLLMLVSAFAGMAQIQKAYQLAIKERMRFFSYGDCMLITGKV